MITEGKGRHAPAPIKMQFNLSTMRILLNESNDRTAYREYGKTLDTWRNELIGDVVIPGMGAIRSDVRAIFCGFMGEQAVCEYINKRITEDRCFVDFKKRAQGDAGIDVSAYGQTLQVKTRQSDKHGNLIRRITDRGRTLDFTANAFVFCKWEGFRTVELLGWIRTKDVLLLPVVPAIVGNHKNIQIPDDALECMNSLADHITARKEMSQCH